MNTRTTAPRRLSFGPVLMAALVLATLVPAVLVSWLLSSNSSRAIETLAQSAMSQAAYRVDVGALAHLGESHTVLNALVPPVATTGAEAERTRQWLDNPAAFELMAYALTQQSPNVPYLYFGTEDGRFFGLEREDQGFVVRGIQPGDSGRRHYLIAQPGDRSRLIKTETSIYDPRQRPWYRLAQRTGQRVFTNVYRSAVKDQFDLTLAHPIYGNDQKTLLGVMAVDMSLARLTELIRSTRVSENAVTYLVDAEGLLVASSVNEDLNRPLGGRHQRIKPEQSSDPLVQASYRMFRNHPTGAAPGLVRLETQQDWLQRLGLSNNRLMAMQRPFGQKYQLDWRLIVVAPEQDFTGGVTRARQWALAAMAGLIGASVLLALVLARRLSGQFRQLNAAALRLGAGEVPPVMERSPLSEVHNLSQVMHDSAVQLQAYHAEVQQKNAELRDAAQLLEQRVQQRTAELAASREDALSAVRAKAGFLAVMSHEIRTPLHGVVGMSELLADSTLDPAQRELVAVLQTSSDQLLAVVDDILDFSKIEAGRLELEDLPLDLRTTLEQVCDMLRSRARDKGLALELDIDTAAPAAIRGDVTRLRQVLLNLLSNAIKFTHQGRVTLTVQVMDASLRFAVSDTGVGIRPEHLPRLFQPFAQGDTSTTRVHGGTGLGLLICKHLVELMGGRIDVQSTPDQGSTFHFTLPVQPAALSDVAQPPVRQLPREHHSQRVLVVDDLPANLQIAAAMLQRLGYPQQGVDSGEAALRALRDAAATGQPFSIVLLDSHMPGMDGEATARAIVQAWGAQAPIIIGVSASSLGTDRPRSLAAGMHDTLPKPLTLQRLADSLRHWSQAGASAPDTPAAESATPHPQAVLDQQRWQELAAFDDPAGSLQQAIAQDFIDQLPALVEAIHTAAEQHDTPALLQAAHALKGAAQNLGAQALGQLCRQIEDAAREPRVDIEALSELDARARAATDAVTARLSVQR
jgi:signal transduction histidine kinase/CheY-like chemotaxis protein